MTVGLEYKLVEMSESFRKTLISKKWTSVGEDSMINFIVG